MGFRVIRSPVKAETASLKEHTNHVSQGQKKTLFDAWDRNRDGRLTKNELPPGRARANFEKVDRNADGFISREEDSAFRNRYSTRPFPYGLPFRQPPRRE